MLASQSSPSALSASSPLAQSPENSPSNTSSTTLIRSHQHEVTETNRQRENELALNDLKERIEDWKGLDPDSFGSLVQAESLMVEKSERQHEYRVYLFERIILCCKEKPAKRSKLSLNLRSKYLGNQRSMSAGKRANTLRLKGRVFTANVISAEPRPVLPGSTEFDLQVTWHGDTSEDYFIVKCPTEEQQRSWQAAITLAVANTLERHRLRVASLARLVHN